MRAKIREVEKRIVFGIEDGPIVATATVGQSFRAVELELRYLWSNALGRWRNGGASCWGQSVKNSNEVLGAAWAPGDQETPSWVATAYITNYPQESHNVRAQVSPQPRSPRARRP